MGLAGAVGSGLGGGSKQPANAANTGQPAWASGSGGNSMVSSAGGQPTTQTQYSANGTGGSTSPAGGSGNWWEPGTEAYNNMNTQLTTAPMKSLVDMFQNGGLTDVMKGVQDNLANSTGKNDWMTDAASLFKNLGTEGTKNFQGVYDKAGQPGSAETNLQDYATGKLIGKNPYTDAIVQKGQEEAQSGLNQMFAAGGRYGSGTNQGVVADSFQDISNKFRGQQYNQDVANQLAATGQISAEQANRLGIQNNAASGIGGLQTSAAQGLGGLGTSAMSNWLSSQKGAADIGQLGQGNIFNAMGQLKNVQDNKNYDADKIAGIGREADSATQGQIDDLVNEWGQGDMEGWARLGGLLSAGTGSAGNWGTSKGSTTQSSEAGWGSIIGGLLSLL